MGLYSHDWKVARKIDHSDSNIDYKIKRQKAKKQEPGSHFARIDSDKEYFDVFGALNLIFRHIKLVVLRILGLEFKSGNINVVNIFFSVISKKYLGQYINVSNTFFPLHQIILLQVKVTTTYWQHFKKLRAKTLVLEELNYINAYINLCCLCQEKIMVY